MNKSQLSPLQGETPVQGEITDRLLTGQILASSRPTNKTATAITVIILFLLTLVAAVLIILWLNPFASNPATEWPDMNLTEFKKRLGTREMEPVGASHIYYKKWQEGGQFDTWILMDISPDSFASLLARKERQMTEPNLSKKASARPTIPERWAELADARRKQSGVEQPLWWEPKSAGKGLKCTRWQLQETPNTAKGWYWVYDPNPLVQRLWIWEWCSRGRLGAASAEEEQEGPEETK